MIRGMGVDLVSVPRMADVLRRQGHRFEERVFTEGERAYCRSKAAAPEHYAARFAAKEAVLKAAGVGLLELSSCRVVGRPDDTHLLLEHRSRQQLVRHWEHGQSLLALTVSTLDQEVSWQGLGAMEATR